MALKLPKKSGISFKKGREENYGNNALQRSIRTLEISADGETITVSDDLDLGQNDLTAFIGDFNHINSKSLDMNLATSIIVLATGTDEFIDIDFTSSVTSFIGGVLNKRGIDILLQPTGAGVGELIGVFIDDVTGGTENHAIKTGVGQVEIGDDFYFINSGSGLPFAQIYEEDGSSTLALAAQDTFYQITAFSVNGESNDAVPDHTNDHITIGKAGKYLVNANVAISSAQKNEYDIHVKKNNGTTDYAQLSMHRTTSVAGAVGSISCSGIIDVANGDTIEMWAKRLDGAAVSKTITIVNASITLTQIGGT